MKCTQKQKCCVDFFLDNFIDWIKKGLCSKNEKKTYVIEFFLIILLVVAISYLAGYFPQGFLPPNWFWSIWWILIVLAGFKIFINANDRMFTIIGFIITFFLGIMAIPLQQRLSSPQNMSIEFRMETPFAIETMTANKSDDALYKIYLFRLIIKNNSTVNANNCIPMITQYWHVRDGNKYEESNFEPLRVGWSDNIRVNIPPGGKYFISFLKIAEAKYQLESEKNLSGDYSKPQLRFFALSWPRWISSHIPKGEHNILVTVYFDNRQPLQQKFNIKWSGEWKDDYKSMMKEIAINKITE